MKPFGRTSLAVVLLLTSSLIGCPAIAENIDERLYGVLHDAYRSSEMDVLMKAATRLGDHPAILGGSLFLATYGGPKEREASKLLFTGLVGTQAVVGGLKYGVNRPRPEGLSPRTNSSFPSGHAAGAFVVATVLADRYRAYRVPLYVGASAVCFSRVYLGRHYPGDVLAGALLGYVGAKVTLHFEKRVLKISL